MSARLLGILGFILIGAVVTAPLNEAGAQFLPVMSVKSKLIAPFNKMALVKNIFVICATPYQYFRGFPTSEYHEIDKSSGRSQLEGESVDKNKSSFSCSKGLSSGLPQFISGFPKGESEQGDDEATKRNKRPFIFVSEITGANSVKIKPYDAADDNGWTLVKGLIGIVALCLLHAILKRI